MAEMNEKKVAILQSNYIPWKGYFDIINYVDEFIIYDDVQFTKRDWRNRNLIKSRQGLIWLTIPVNTKGKQTQKINNTEISNSFWREKHWRAIKTNYSKAPYFSFYAPLFEEAYLNTDFKYLSNVNYHFIQIINKCLGIKTKISLSDQYNLEGNKTEKLISICKQVDASQYLTGTSAKNYLETDLFKQENIEVSWMDYFGYPEYRQSYPPFVHELSIIDLIFNEGENACRFMKSFNK